MVLLLEYNIFVLFPPLVVMLLSMEDQKARFHQKYPTQAHWKYVPLNTFLQHRYYVPYCTCRSSFKVKHPVSGTKTQVQYVTLARFFYVDIDTYGCGS